MSRRKTPNINFDCVWETEFFIFLIFVYLAVLGLSWGMRDLCCGMHVGSSSLTRDQTLAPCTGSERRVLTTGPPGKSWETEF